MTYRRSSLTLSYMSTHTGTQITRLQQVVAFAPAHEYSCGAKKRVSVTLSSRRFSYRRALEPGAGKRERACRAKDEAMPARASTCCD